MSRLDMLLTRFQFSEESTIGELSLNGKHFCYTLEDKVRGGEKVPKKTAIPYGHYSVIIDMSNRFKRELPHVLDVPNFEGIRIHSGNTAEDTEGCILVGTRYLTNKVLDSRVAFNLLFSTMLNYKEIYLDIKKR